MKNRKQHLLINEKQSGLGMYLFGLSSLGELSNDFTKQSNFVEDILEEQGGSIQSDTNDTQKRTQLEGNVCKGDKYDNTDDKKNEITIVVGLMSVFN